MKRFSKVLALGLALATVFGMSVSAAPSPTPWQVPGTVTSVGEMPKGWTQGTITEEAYNNAVKAAESSKATAQIAAKMPGWTFDAVMDVWNFGWYNWVDEDGKTREPESGTVKVKLPALPDRDNYTYVLMHFNTANWSEFDIYPDLIEIKPADWDNNYWTFKVDGGSPLLFVRLIKTSVLDSGKTEDNGGAAATAPVADASAPAAGTNAGAVVSPKTGEAMPVATMMVLVCLAGVAVCAKKARSNG